MSDDDARRADLLRRFDSIISDAGLDDLRQIADGLSLLGGSAGPPSVGPPPDLRRRSPPALTVLRVRADLVGSRPPIWRRLQLRGDLTLEALHRVLQAAFGWTDTHLWRFSLGGDAFDRSAQQFLCQWDAEEGEEADEGGIPAADVRLDEVLQASGDVLFYTYDYGDNWDLTLRLEESQAAPGDAPMAVALDGRRSGPPEDCGGLRTAADLAEVLDDPAAFDLDELNASLRHPYFQLAGSDVAPRLVEIVYRLGFTRYGDDLARRTLAVATSPAPLDEPQLRRALVAFTWFLDRAAEGQLRLTAAGYLTPAEVTAAAAVVPTMDGWIGKANREDLTAPVLAFRELLQTLGLLRKYKGELRLTRAGAAARKSPQRLWRVLAERLIPRKAGFDLDATLLLLVHVATSAGETPALDDIAGALAELGWRLTDGTPIGALDLYRLTALDLLRNLSGEPASRLTDLRVSPTAAALAHAAFSTD